MTKINPKLAVDLDAVKLDAQRKADEEKAAAELRKQREDAVIEEAAKEWERSMNRMFRGILTRKERRRMFERRFSTHEDEQVTT